MATSKSTADKSKADATKDDEKVDAAKTEPTPTGETERSDTQHEDLPTSPEKKEDESLADQVEEDFAETGVAESVDGALGVVTERDVHGDEYDVPWLYLTAAEVEATPARTSDWDDNGRSWTAQEVNGERKDEDDNDLAPVALVEVEATPGQVFRVRELPNRKVAEAAGIDYAQWVTGLPVRPDVVDEQPRRGTPA